MSDRILPERTAPTEYTVDPETGETTLIVEHFRQGENRYRIVHSLAASVEGEDVNQQTPRRWTRLSIKTALATAGILADARQYLASVEIATGYTAWEALTDCDYIEEGYPNAESWNALLDGAAQALGKTRADIDAFLANIPTEG